MLVSRLYNTRTSQSIASSLGSLTGSTANSSVDASQDADSNPSIDFTMTDTFFVTPIGELEKLDDWRNPLAFQAAHHHENLNVSDAIEVEWRLRDRVRATHSTTPALIPRFYLDENS